MSDTNGLQNADAQGVPAEDDPERFETGATPGTDQGGEGSVPPPAEFDPAEQPSNPDLVRDTELDDTEVDDTEPPD